MRVLILPTLIVTHIFLTTVQILRSWGFIKKTHCLSKSKVGENRTARLKTANREQSPFQF